ISLPDVFVPQIGMRGDEISHQSNAPFVLNDVDANAAIAQQRFLTHERVILADHYVWNAVKEDRAGAHRARRERRVHHAFAIHRCELTTRALERVHLAVQDGAALLHTAIVATAEHAIAMHEHRADRNASFSEAALGLLDRDGEK